MSSVSINKNRLATDEDESNFKLPSRGALSPPDEQSTNNQLAASTNKNDVELKRIPSRPKDISKSKSASTPLYGTSSSQSVPSNMLQKQKQFAAGSANRSVHFSAQSNSLSNNNSVQSQDSTLQSGSPFIFTNMKKVKKTASSSSTSSEETSSSSESEQEQQKSKQQSKLLNSPSKGVMSPSRLQSSMRKPILDTTTIDETSSLLSIPGAIHVPDSQIQYGPSDSVNNGDQSDTDCEENEEQEEKKKKASKSFSRIFASSASASKSILKLPEIPIRDQIQMSPWKKLTRYRRFPYKFAIHIVLVCLVTIQVLLFSQQRETYLYNAQQTLSSTFMPEGSLSLIETGDGYVTSYFYDVDSFVKFMGETVDTYYNFVGQSLDFFIPRRYNSSEDDLNDNHIPFSSLYKPKKSGVKETIDQHVGNTTRPVILNILYYSSLNFSDINFSEVMDKSTDTIQFELDQDDPFGPFTSLVKSKNSVLKKSRQFYQEKFKKSSENDDDDDDDDDEKKENALDLLRKMIQMEMKFGYSTIYILKNVPECMKWDITLTFDFSARGGTVPLILKHNVELCTSEDTSYSRVSWIVAFLNPIVWICVFVIIFSLISSFLLIKAMYVSYTWVRAAQKDFKVYLMIRKARFYHDVTPSLTNDFLSSKYEDELVRKQKKMTWVQKFNLMNPWHMIGLAANALEILSSVLTLLNSTFKLYSLHYTNIVLGISAILTWTNMVQYFAHFPQFYVLITTLRKGLPNVIRFIIGALPILIGYALCGLILFGSYSKFFRNLTHSVVTLFSVTNGDIIHDGFSSVYGQSTLLAYISRVYLFSYIVLFTYAVLNIFIFIMEDAFSTIQEYGAFELQKKLEANNQSFYNSDAQSQDGNSVANEQFMENNTAKPYDEEEPIIESEKSTETVVSDNHIKELEKLVEILKGCNNKAHQDTILKMIHSKTKLVEEDVE